MRTALACLLLALGCTPAGERRADTAPPAADPPFASAASPADSAPSAPGGLEWECNRAQDIVQRALNAPVSRDTARTFDAPVEGRWAGCRYTASLTLPVETQEAPETTIRRGFDAEGWAPVIDYDAGGATGSAFAYREGETLCHVADEVLLDIPDPGSPSDTMRREPVPHAIELRCTSPVPPPRS